MQFSVVGFPNFRTRFTFWNLLLKHNVKILLVYLYPHTNFASFFGLHSYQVEVTVDLSAFTIMSLHCPLVVTIRNCSTSIHLSKEKRWYKYIIILIYYYSSFFQQILLKYRSTTKNGKQRTLGTCVMMKWSCSLMNSSCCCVFLFICWIRDLIFEFKCHVGVFCIDS